MIVVTARLVVTSKQRKGLWETLRGLPAPKRFEKGCLGYHLYQDCEDRNALYLVEEWKTLEDLKRHIRSEDYRMILAAMDICSEEPEIKIHTVSNTRGMDFLHETLQLRAMEYNR